MYGKNSAGLGLANEYMFKRPSFTDIHCGRTWWVDSNGPGAAVARGSFDRPFTTVDLALNHVTVNNGDVVYVKQKHVETHSASGSLTFDKAGVFVIGLGQYDQRPKFTLDTITSNKVLVTAADVWLENMIFTANFADIATGFLVTGKGCHLINLKVEETAAGMNFKIGVSVGAATNDADGFTCVGCEFDLPDAANTQAISLLKGQRDVTIVGNRILGIFVASGAPILGADEAFLNILVADNMIHNRATSGNTMGVDIQNTASKGWIIRNLCGGLDATKETPFLGGAAGLGLAENYYTGVLGTKSGYLRPVVDS